MAEPVVNASSAFAVLPAAQLSLLLSICADNNSSISTDLANLCSNLTANSTPHNYRCLDGNDENLLTVPYVKGNDSNSSDCLTEDQLLVYFGISFGLFCVPFACCALMMVVATVHAWMERKHEQVMMNNNHNHNAVANGNALANGHAVPNGNPVNNHYLDDDIDDFGEIGPLIPPYNQNNGQ